MVGVPEARPLIMLNQFKPRVCPEKRCLGAKILSKQFSMNKHEFGKYLKESAVRCFP